MFVRHLGLIGIMIDLAIRQAESSSFERAPMGAVLTKGNKILGSGQNKTNRHQSKIRTTSWPGSLHAEVACVLDALRKHPADKLKGATMTVVRLGKKNKLRLAKPCDSCYNVIRNLGIKEVRFSNDIGGFTNMRFE